MAFRNLLLSDVLVPVAALALFLVILARRRRPSNLKPLPSPPGGLPLLGNVLQLPKENSFLQLHEWSKTLGPIYSLNMAGVPMIVLSTATVANDLLEKRSQLYAGRPESVMIDDFITRGLVVGFTPFGERWKRFRKAAHAGINIRAAEAYYGIMEREAAYLVQQLHSDPSGWDDHLRRVVASSIFTALYGGEPLLERNHAIVEKINDFMHRITVAATPGSFLIDIFPVLKRLPDWLYKAKGVAEEDFHEDDKLFNKLIDQIRQDMAKGSHVPSFGRMLLEAEDQFGLKGRELPWLAASMFGAGSDATAGNLRWFMLAAVLFPDKIQRAREEIDSVVGRSRLPTFDDRENLPYTRALIREVMRWRTVAPLGVPHRLLEDDVYEGYYLPKDSIIIANIYGINRSPEIYGADADVFRPERFLSTDGSFEVIHAETKNQGHFTFGFGRRACAGMHVANNLFFINVAAILWSFDLGVPKGKELPSATDYHDSGLVVRPHLWDMEFKPRGPVPLKVAKERFARGA